MMKKTFRIKRVLLVGIICVIPVWLVLQVVVFATFRIPSDSMYPALEAGDRILVNKLVMGGRIFNVWNALDKDNDIAIYRLPAWGEIRRNDVLVFNYPYSRGLKRISFNVMSYFVKRCVALPGDTFEIENARYRVRGRKEDLGNVRSQLALHRLLENTDAGYGKGIVVRAYPRDTLLGWTIDRFGPFYIPRKGDCLPMDRKNVSLYRYAVEWEQKRKLEWKDGKACLGDSVIASYRFGENYYFVVGDNAANSRDSRYWGLLPEPYIVGKATRIWTSADPDTNETRWERCGKRIE